MLLWAILIVHFSLGLFLTPNFLALSKTKVSQQLWDKKQRLQLWDKFLSRCFSYVLSVQQQQRIAR
jgi:hypothetical protein